jgi:ATP-binding cassette subfamily B protein
MTHPMRALLVALGLVALAELAQVWLSRLLEARSWRVRLDLDFALRQRVTATLHQLPLSYHQGQTVGGTVSRVNTSINGFVTAVAEIAFKVLPAIAYLALALAAMLQLDWRLALAVCLFAPLPALIGMRAAPEQTRRDRVLLAHWTQTFGRWTEVLSGIRTVKGFAMERPRSSASSAPWRKATSASRAAPAATRRRPRFRAFPPPPPGSR